MFVDPKYKQMQYKSDKYSRREESDTASERTLKGQDQKSRRGSRGQKLQKTRDGFSKVAMGNCFERPNFSLEISVLNFWPQEL